MHDACMRMTMTMIMKSSIRFGLDTLLHPFTSYQRRASNCNAPSSVVSAFGLHLSASTSRGTGRVCAGRVFFAVEFSIAEFDHVAGHTWQSCAWLAVVRQVGGCGCVGVVFAFVRSTPPAGADYAGAVIAANMPHGSAADQLGMLASAAVSYAGAVIDTDMLGMPHGSAADQLGLLEQPAAAVSFCRWRVRTRVLGHIRGPGCGGFRPRRRLLQGIGEELRL